MRRLLLLLLSFLPLHCGGDSSQDGGAAPTLPGPDPGALGALALDARLDGRYVESVRIADGTFAATGPGQEVSITFAASGLAQVKQFEFHLRISPSQAFDLSASSFQPVQPFIAPPTSIELTESGLWRTGGASVTRIIEGDVTLGTLRLKTAAGFDADTQVRIQVEFFSIGPSFSDRDDYTASDLGMGVLVNGP